MDRAAGAIMGALIGDALGLGCHWYYDLAELRRDYGDWITGYTTPKPERYHGGMRAGELSQSGLIMVMLLESVVEHGEYSEEDFTRRLDEKLFPLLNGTPVCGPGGYTNQSIREAYRRRIQQHKSWHETGGHADTTESAERAIVLAVRYAKHPHLVARFVSSNCMLTQADEAIVAMSTAYNAVLSLLVNGEKLTPDISGKLMHLVHSNELPFHAVTKSDFSAPRPGDPDPPLAGRFSSPDALLTPHYMALAALDPGISIEPAWKAAIVYGMPCAIYHQLPAAYYLAARFANDFESAVLHAINGGGQNMSRAMLTGALVGAQVGLDGIPQRFINGLDNGERLLELAKKLGTRL
ncbi:ADP-ribosylglycohydrolase [Sulfuriferula sp. AH1]|uniref:ADP-ribosylglycohydrolase family protein n=1 Tax=Sulfuriferula sp. AH1 TaxID=1985873 RepID=UPI000B3B58A2|nr:ADP-ribosylglycohydrolase family protein [Sulfuriferula sp. AH1]ARU30697.1 ADP-ribosylglycohydrolase [Sulfuriferula sp. AH1]